MSSKTSRFSGRLGRQSSATDTTDYLPLLYVHLDITTHRAFIEWCVVCRILGKHTPKAKQFDLAVRGGPKNRTVTLDDRVKALMQTRGWDDDEVAARALAAIFVPAFQIRTSDNWGGRPKTRKKHVPKKASQAILPDVHSRAWNEALTSTRAVPRVRMEVLPNGELRVTSTIQLRRQRFRWNP